MSTLLSGETKAQILDLRDPRVLILDCMMRWGYELGCTWEHACVPARVPPVLPCSILVSLLLQDSHAGWSHSAQPLPLSLAGCTGGISKQDVSLSCKHVRGCTLSKEEVLCSVPEICWAVHYTVNFVAESHFPV